MRRLFEHIRSAALAAENVEEKKCISVDFVRSLPWIPGLFM
jgi:hypothetical protein